MASYLIDSPRYGEPCSFLSLDEAERDIRLCGPDFARVELEERNGLVFDQTGEQVGLVEY